MTVRLAEIAQRAGVSVSTVSRVLNEKPGVNEHTRRQVLTAVDVLGYDRPSRLRPRSAGLVGVVVPELENPFFPRFVQAVEVNLARYGYTPLLCSQSLGGVHEDDYVQMLLDHGVSGIIFVSGLHAIAGSDPDRYRRLLDMGVPVAFVNGYLPDVPAPFVSNDDAAAVRLAVTHLRQMGHDRIGLAVGQERYTPVIRRIAAFREAVREYDAGIADEPLTARIQCTTFTVEGGLLAARRLVAEGVTAIVCGSDVMALGVMRAARQLGLRVPEDVSIVGSDDNMFIEFTDPPLTTVRQPVAALAEASCRHLIDQISGLAPVVGDLTFPPELVVRGSTAAAPGARHLRRASS